jgi:hypothetical protein
MYVCQEYLANHDVALGPPIAHAGVVLAPHARRALLARHCVLSGLAVAFSGQVLALGTRGCTRRTAHVVGPRQA